MSLRAHRSIRLLAVLVIAVAELVPHAFDRAPRHEATATAVKVASF